MQGLESWHLCLPVATVCLHADFFLFLADEPLIFLSGGQAERETAGGFFQVIT